MKRYSSYLLSVMFGFGTSVSSSIATPSDLGQEFFLESDLQALYFPNSDDSADPSYQPDASVNSFLELLNPIDGSDSIHPAN